ncbi:MAG: hypothetical protein ACD_78C00129G0001, partial [uncultured bacterium (gcode 4)]
RFIYFSIVLSSGGLDAKVLKNIQKISATSVFVGGFLLSIFPHNNRGNLWLKNGLFQTIFHFLHFFVLHFLHLNKK